MLLIPDLNVVHLETLTLRDQILALKDAKLVISPHGASMYNLVFCREGTQVVEVFPRNTEASIIHRHYCSVLGHPCITYIEDKRSSGFPYDQEYAITAEGVVNQLTML
jgi:capsular polysaccharide biosynthesis protein